MIRKSVRKYRSRRRTAQWGRPVHSSRSQGSGMSTTVLRWPEIDFRNLARFRGCFEERMLLEAEDSSREVGGELPARGVVFAHAIVVSHALDRDAILGARELVHEPVELLVRPELRIVLDDREQPAERRGLLVGGLNRLFG